MRSVAASRFPARGWSISHGAAVLIMASSWLSSIAWLSSPSLTNACGSDAMMIRRNTAAASSAEAMAAGPPWVVAACHADTGCHNPSGRKPHGETRMTAPQASLSTTVARYQGSPKCRARSAFMVVRPYPRISGSCSHPSQPARIADCNSPALLPAAPSTAWARYRVIWVSSETISRSGSSGPRMSISVSRP